MQKWTLFGGKDTLWGKWAYLSTIFRLFKMLYLQQKKALEEDTLCAWNLSHCKSTQYVSDDSFFLNTLWSSKFSCRRGMFLGQLSHLRGLLTHWVKAKMARNLLKPTSILQLISRELQVILLMIQYSVPLIIRAMLLIWAFTVLNLLSKLYLV